MFINFWYVAATSTQLTEKPLRIRMLGQNFVLFRDAEGQAHCLSNVCTHRGGSLAGGRVRGGHIECPYHGWQFNGAGACKKIPSLGPADGVDKIPSRTKVDSYPVQEKYGLIFAFLGDLPEAERPPIMEIAEWGPDGVKDGWRATVQQPGVWKIDYKRSIENSIDPAHNEYVHDTHGFSGERDDYRVQKLDFKESPWGIGFFNKMYSPPLREEKMRAASGRAEDAFIDAGTGHHGPSMVWTYIHPSPKTFIHQYLFETPIDEVETRLFLVTLRNFMTTDADDKRIMERNLYVAAQDQKVLEDIEPAGTPTTNTHEVFMPADVPIARYREFCKEWEARGWRIDLAKVAQHRGHTVYAIPSPGRREAKGWVIDPVPLIPGLNKVQAAAE
ncbi:MAG: aromatic ring-hydroxylating dioxygenase subunit alpha [Rhodospirillaceae bacterium]|nr:aromatic ring-hydroxylating dioxygenase subunit alpha [Rhodospirillaceae bacterium]